jgi:shikimate dehydrogenase
MTIDQHTSLYGVIGNPVGHSLSPVMHNAAFSATGLNAVYLAFETEDVEGCLRGMRALHIKGMSVTVPHKSAVIPYLDDIDPLAKMIGAVNTIVNENGRLVGYNTDARGAAQALEEKIDLTGRNCLILGAGGAARAIGFILREKGVRLTVTNRSDERGKELAAALGSPYYPLNKLEERRPDLLIQTTSVGMYPHVDRSLAPEHILKPGVGVMDIIYNPVETKLLTMARTRGCVTIGGLSMFIHQGAEQFRLWTGMTPPLSAMTDAVKKTLLGTK